MHVLYVYHFRNDYLMGNTYRPLYLRMSKMSPHATNCLTCLMSKYQHVLTLLNIIQLLFICLKEIQLTLNLVARRSQLKP